MKFTTIVKVELEESKHPLSGVKVSLFDKDKMSKDDLLGTRTTNNKGKIYFKYDSSKFSDFLGDEATFGWGGWGAANSFRPDLYVKIYNQKGDVVLSTQVHIRKNAHNNTVITIPISESLARQYGLIISKPHRTPKEKTEQWIKQWKDTIAKLPPDAEPPVDFCFTRTVLDIIEGLDDPNNDLQKRAAKMLDGKVSKEDIKKVGKLAKNGIKAIDELNIPNTMCNSSDDTPKNLAERLTKPGGPLHEYVESLSAAYMPMPDLPSPRAGLPFTHPFEDWNKTCAENFEHCINHLPCTLNPDALEQMKDYYRDKLNLLTRPSINQIEVWDGNGSGYARVRDASPQEKRLSMINHHCSDGIQETILDMDVPLDDKNCLYNVEDGQTPGNQILATDVKPGQKIVFHGSGFINETAKLRVEFQRWDNNDSHGRLVPIDGGNPNVFSLSDTELNVYGNYPEHGSVSASDYCGDHIYFDWPDIAGDAGLYKIWLEFENKDQIPTSAHQDPHTCELEIVADDIVKSQEIYLTVVPSLVPKKIKITIPGIQCIDEKDPESFGPIPSSDNIDIEISTLLTTLNGDGSGPFLVSGEHEFWDDGDSWLWGKEIFSADGNYHELTIGSIEQLLTTQLLVNEVLTDADKYLLGLISIILIAVVLILIVAIVALIIGTGGGFAIIAGFIFGAVWTATSAAAIALINSMTSADPIAYAQLPISGSSLAQKYSSFRIHKLFLCPVDLPSSVASYLGLKTTITEVNNNGDLVYKINSKNHSIKSEYEINVLVDIL